MAIFVKVNSNTLRCHEAGLVLLRFDDKKTWRVYNMASDCYPTSPAISTKFRLGRTAYKAAFNLAEQRIAKKGGAA